MTVRCLSVFLSPILRCFISPSIGPTQPGKDLPPSSVLSALHDDPLACRLRCSARAPRAPRAPGSPCHSCLPANTRFRGPGPERGLFWGSPRSPVVVKGEEPFPKAVWGQEG